MDLYKKLSNKRIITIFFQVAIVFFIIWIIIRTSATDFVFQEYEKNLVKDEKISIEDIKIPQYRLQIQIEKKVSDNQNNTDTANSSLLIYCYHRNGSTYSFILVEDNGGFTFKEPIQKLEFQPIYTNLTVNLEVVRFKFNFKIYLFIEYGLFGAFSIYTVIHLLRYKYDAQYQSEKEAYLNKIEKEKMEESS